MYRPLVFGILAYRLVELHLNDMNVPRMARAHSQ
jgi:hypothetical protein